MQVSATLIAAQQAAREARARLQPPQASQETFKPNFAAALEKAPATSSGFSPLPLKQTAPTAPAQAQPQASGRLGQYVNIIV